MVGQLLSRAPKQRVRHNHEVQPAVGVQRVQVLVGHAPKGARRGQRGGLVGPESHELAQGVGAGQKGIIGFQGHHRRPARVGHVPDGGAGRAAQAVAVQGGAAGIGEGAKLQHRPGQGQLPLKVDFQIIQVAGGARVAGRVVAQGDAQLVGGAGGQAALLGGDVGLSHFVVQKSIDRRHAQLLPKRLLIGAELKRGRHRRRRGHGGRDGERRVGHEAGQVAKREFALLFISIIESLAQPLPAGAQQVHQVAVVHQPLLKSADVGGRRSGRRRGRHGRHAAAGRAHCQEIIGRVGVDVINVLKPAVAGLPGVGAAGIKQQKLILVEAGIAVVAHYLHGVLHEVVGAVGGVGLGQQAGGIAEQLQAARVEAGRVQPQPAERGPVELIDAAGRHPNLVPLAGGQHRGRRVAVGRRRRAAAPGREAFARRRRVIDGVHVIKGNELLGLPGLRVAARGLQQQVGHGQLGDGGVAQAWRRAGGQPAQVQQACVGGAEGLIHCVLQLAGRHVAIEAQREGADLLIGAVVGHHERGHLAPGAAATHDIRVSSPANGGVGRLSAALSPRRARRGPAKQACKSQPENKIAHKHKQRNEQQ